jgi:hypothetical protein
VLACGATLPAALGVCLDRESVGFIASFGAYLVTITHADLPINGRAQRLVATILMLCNAYGYDDYSTFWNRKFADVLK